MMKAKMHQETCFSGAFLWFFVRNAVGLILVKFSCCNENIKDKLWFIDRFFLYRFFCGLFLLCVILKFRCPRIILCYTISWGEKSGEYHIWRLCREWWLSLVPQGFSVAKICVKSVKKLAKKGFVW